MNKIRRALVTGGSRGLGYQMVKAFAQHGADVFITSRKQEACEKVAAEVRTMGRKAVAHACNVANWNELEGLVEAAYRAFGRIDILVNGVGDSLKRPLIPRPGTQDPKEPISDADLHFILDLNLTHALMCTRGILRSTIPAAFGNGVVMRSSGGPSTLKELSNERIAVDVEDAVRMNVAAMALRGSALLPDVNRDVNQTAGIVYRAKSSGHTSSVWILGGGSPKNFMLQTEPQIQEVMGIQEKGHDYFLQCTDARPDTGGLSGATPAEAVSWGKVDPEKLPDSVVCYTDSTIALPLLTAYLMARVAPRKLKRLYDHRDPILADVKAKYLATGTVEKVVTSRKVAKRASSIGTKK